MEVANAAEEVEGIGSAGGYVDRTALATHCTTGVGKLSKWYDQSESVDDAVQATDSRRPRIYSGGYVDSMNDVPAVRFGLDNTVRLGTEGGNLLPTNAAGYTVFIRYSLQEAGSYPNAFVARPDAGGFPYVGHFGGDKTDRSVIFYAAGGTAVANAATSIEGLRTRVDRYERGETLSIRRNGVEVDSVAVDNADVYVQGAGHFIGQGGNDTGITCFIGNIDTIVVFDSALSTVEIEAYEASLAALAPAYTAASTVTPTVFTDSTSNVDETTNIDASSFSRLVIETTATILNVTTYNDIYGVYPQFTRIGIAVDGVNRGAIRPTASGAYSEKIYLGSGTKTVALVNGPQSDTGAGALGTWIKSVSGNAAITQTFPTQTGGLLVYGDSIVVGGNSDPVMENAWFPIVRAANPAPSALEAWGFRQLNDDAANGTLRAALVAKIATLAPSTIWLAIGTNDYYFAEWSAASFETAYAALLTDLHTALPSATIYAQTPIVRLTETANVQGSTLGDYRTAISNAASGKAYVTVVDGTAFMTTAELADGVHPTNAGHALYAAAVIAELGL